MNKAVKILLAIAIAVLYPVVAFLVSLTLIPDSKVSDQPPAYPSSADCGSSYSSTNRSYYDSCVQQQRTEYDQQLKQYDDNRNKGIDAKSKVTQSRICIALTLVIIGFACTLLAKSVSAVAAGMAGGSTILLVFASGYAVSGPGNVNLLVEILYLVIFVGLVALMFLVDKIFAMPIQASTAQTEAPKPTPNKSS